MTLLSADQFTYSVNGDEVTITDYPVSEVGAVEIPAEIDGKPVTTIDYYAFYGCSGLTSVTIPEGVAGISSDAFRDCNGLTSVTIPEGLTSIGRAAFYGCSGLTSATIPAGVTRIFNATFSGCTGLTSISIAEGVTSIGAYAFYGCSRLTSVTIPESLTMIGNSAFYSCSGLTSVTISESVTRIDYDAFSGCSSLTSILVASGNPSYASEDGVLFNASKTALIKFPGGKAGAYAIPDSVTTIGYGAFDGCGRLTSILVASGNNGYASEDGVLFNASKTRLIKFPGGKAGAYAIPEGVTTIDYEAFDGCGRLTSVTIPDTVTFVDAESFFGLDIGVFFECSSLTSIHVASGNPSYASEDGVLFNVSKTRLIKFPEGKAGDYTIPEGVTNIFDHAFYGCSGLTSISIPGSVTKIDESTFSKCSSLAKATFLGHAPGVAFYSIDPGYYEGGAPDMKPAQRPVFTEVAPDFTIHRFRSSTGFSSPGWQDYPTVMIDEAPYLGISWLLAHDLPYDTDLHQDLNRDGVSLLTAYALNLDPNLNLQSSLPKPVLGDGSLGISFYGMAEGITYTVETSRDLQTWTTEGVAVSAPDEAGQRTATVSRDSQKGFLRLVVAE